jgi:hypothetical protein
VVSLVDRVVLRSTLRVGGVSDALEAFCILLLRCFVAKADDWRRRKVRVFSCWWSPIILVLSPELTLGFYFDPAFLYVKLNRLLYKSTTETITPSTKRLEYPRYTFWHFSIELAPHEYHDGQVPGAWPCSPGRQWEAGQLQDHDLDVRACST